MFNVFNPPALRDNIRESAVEYALFAHVLAAPDARRERLPGDDGPGALRQLALGADGPLDGRRPSRRSRRLRAALPGGRAERGGGELDRERHLEAAAARHPRRHRRCCSGTPSDAPRAERRRSRAHPVPVGGGARRLRTSTRATSSRTPPRGNPPRNVLMEQGIVDHYIMPPIANATSLSLGLDLLGTPLDDNERRAHRRRATRRSRACSSSPGQPHLDVPGRRATARRTGRR